MAEQAGSETRRAEVIHFFNTPQRIAQLNSVALSWLGTPFHPNGMSKGVGVSCQKLFGAIMIECGVLPVGFTIDDGPVAWNTKEPLLETGMDVKLHDYFENILGASVSGDSPVSSDKGCTDASNLLPGDVIGFRVGGAVRHIGTVINEDVFIHVMRHCKVSTGELRDATWCQRIGRVWRARG